MIDNSDIVTKKVSVITGTIGSGKSTVCEIFKKLGAGVVYADKLARESLDLKVEKLLIDKFGQSITDRSRVSREKLAKLVFTNPSKKKELEEILHPIIRQKSLEQFKSYIQKETPVIIYECPLFFESGLKPKDYQSVILVNSTKELCINRAVKRDHSNKEDIKKRIETQILNKEKIKLCNYVIDNNLDLKHLEKEVINLYAKLIA